MTQHDDASIREFADRGTIWLLGSPANLRDLVAMAAKDIADSLEFSRAERVNRSFVPAKLHKQEADLLYRVPFRAGGVAPGRPLPAAVGAASAEAVGSGGPRGGFQDANAAAA